MDGRIEIIRIEPLVLSGEWLPLHSPHGSAWSTLMNSLELGEIGGGVDNGFGSKLSQWDRDAFGKLDEKIKVGKERLNYLQNREQTEENIRKLGVTRGELDELLKSEETFWFQRSRALWLKDGDHNTSFFHIKASQRRRTNSIFKLKDREGVWVTGEEEVGRVMREFFVELFSSKRIGDMHHIIESIESSFTDSMNDILTDSMNDIFTESS